MRLKGTGKGWRRFLWLGGLGTAGLALLWVGSHPDRAHTFREVCCPRLTVWLNLASGWTSLSLAEMLLLSLLGMGLWESGRILASLLGGRGWPGGGGKRIVTWFRAGLLLLVLFYGLWGVSYWAGPILERVSWLKEGNGEELAEEELGRLWKEVMGGLNRSYLQAHGKEDLGHPSRPELGNREMTHLLEEGYQRVAELLQIPHLGMRLGPAKPLWNSWLLSRLGLGGFYFPWTGEANYNGHWPGLELPHAVAHEMAHQRCVPLEDEANFLGFLACLLSPHPYLKYSAYAFAWEELASEPRLSPRLGEELAPLPGVLRDWEAARRFHLSQEGAATRFSRSVNDRYLRLQGVPEGLASYRASLRWLIRFYRSRGSLP